MGSLPWQCLAEQGGATCCSAIDGKPEETPVAKAYALMKAAKRMTFKLKHAVGKQWGEVRHKAVRNFCRCAIVLGAKRNPGIDGTGMMRVHTNKGLDDNGKRKLKARFCVRGDASVAMWVAPRW